MTLFIVNRNLIFDQRSSDLRHNFGYDVYQKQLRTSSPIQWPLSFSSFKLYFYHMYETPEKTIGMIIETNVTCHLITLSIISNLSFLCSLIVPLFFVQLSDCCLIGSFLFLACSFALGFQFSSVNESCSNSSFYYGR